MPEEEREEEKETTADTARTAATTAAAFRRRGFCDGAAGGVAPRRGVLSKEELIFLEVCPKCQDPFLRSFSTALVGSAV